MRAGRLRRRVTIQSQSTSRDAAGQPVDTWTDVATVWAAVEDVQGREIIRGGGAVTAHVTTTVRMRHRTDIDTGMRIVDGSRILLVAAPPIDLDGRRREIEVLCQEVTP